MSQLKQQHIQVTHLSQLELELPNISANSIPIFPTNSMYNGIRPTLVNPYPNHIPRESLPRLLLPDWSPVDFHHLHRTKHGRSGRARAGHGISRSLWRWMHSTVHLRYIETATKL